MTNPISKEIAEEYRRIVCWFRGHLFMEWSHDDSLPRYMFKKGTAILKKPYCVRCGLLFKK